MQRDEKNENESSLWCIARGFCSLVISGAQWKEKLYLGEEILFVTTVVSVPSVTVCNEFAFCFSDTGVYNQTTKRLNVQDSELNFKDDEH